MNYSPPTSHHQDVCWNWYVHQNFNITTNQNIECAIKVSFILFTGTLGECDNHMIRGVAYSHHCKNVRSAVKESEWVLMNDLQDPSIHFSFRWMVMLLLRLTSISDWAWLSVPVSSLEEVLFWRRRGCYAWQAKGLWERVSRANQFMKCPVNYAQGDCYKPLHNYDVSILV